MDRSSFTQGDYVDLFFDLFETSSDAVFIVRVADGVVLDVNESALSLWGYSRADAIGHSTIDLGLWATPSERDPYIEAVRKSGRVRNFPVRFRTRWSEEFTVNLSATLVQLRGEEVILGVGVVTRPR